MTKQETATLLSKVKARKDSKHYDCKILSDGSILQTRKRHKRRLTGNLSLLAEEDKLFGKIHNLGGR